MHRRRANAAGAMASIERNGEKNVRRLRATVGDEGLVGRLLEAGIFKVHVAVAMAGRGEINDAAAAPQQRGDLVDEDEVTEVIRAELGLESIHGLAERRGHDAGIGDDHVERLALGQQAVGGFADALQAGEIELHELERAAVGCGDFPHVARSAFRLG